MTGREFVKALEAQGFIVKRRCKSFVWVARGEQQLMIDEDATIPDAFLERLLRNEGPRSGDSRAEAPKLLRDDGSHPG